MVLHPEQERIQSLLSEAVTVLCKSSLKYKLGFSVQGLLGITIFDSDQVLLIDINETVHEVAHHEESNKEQDDKTSPTPHDEMLPLDTTSDMHKNPVTRGMKRSNMYQDSGSLPKRHHHNNSSTRHGMCTSSGSKSSYGYKYWKSQVKQEVSVNERSAACLEELSHSDASTMISDNSDFITSNIANWNPAGGQLDPAGLSPGEEAEVNIADQQVTPLVICPVVLEDVPAEIGLSQDISLSAFMHDNKTDICTQISLVETEILLYEGQNVPVRLLEAKMEQNHMYFEKALLLQAMDNLHKIPGHPLYVGDHMCLQGNVHVFYKCPPSMVSQKALKQHGIDLDTYREKCNERETRQFLQRIFPDEESEIRYMNRIKAGVPLRFSLKDLETVSRR